MRLLSELDGVKTEENSTRIRANGGGRKLLEEQDPMLLSDLESLIEPMTLGAYNQIVRPVMVHLTSIGMTSFYIFLTMSFSSRHK